MSKQAFAFTGVFIPAHIWGQPGLQMLDKVVWAAVSHWHSGDMICTATDAEIADFLGDNEMSVTASVLKLIALGYLHIAEADNARTLWIANAVFIEKEKETTETQASTADVQRIVDLYNESCKSMPRAEKLTPSRLRRVRALLKDHDEEYFKLLFLKAHNSEFLSGKSGRWNGCNIDWILAPANIDRITEGVYDNRHASQPLRLPGNLRT